MSDLRGTVVWVLRSETRALRPGPTCREGARDTAGLGKRGERPVHFAELTSVATSALVWAGRHYFPVFYRKASERGRLRPRPHRESPQTGGRRTLRTKCSEGLCAHSPQPLESLPGQPPAGTPLLESARVPRPSLEKRRGGGGVPRAGLCNPSGPAHSLGTPACPCPPWGGGGGRPGSSRLFSTTGSHNSQNQVQLAGFPNTPGGGGELGRGNAGQGEVWWPPWGCCGAPGAGGSWGSPGAVEAPANGDAWEDSPLAFPRQLRCLLPSRGHSKAGKTKAQRGDASCPRSHSQGLGLTLKLSL